MNGVTTKEREAEEEKDELATMWSLLICGCELWAFAIVLLAHYLGLL